MQLKLSHRARDALLGELSGALAHELQQPLTAIMCNAQAAQCMIAKGKIDLQEFSALLDEIVSDDRYAGQVIHRLRALASGGGTQQERLEVGWLVHDLLTLARGTLKAANVQVSIRIGDGAHVVRVDRVQIQLVLLNLIRNACESMSAVTPTNRRIEIVVNENEEAVCISVLDRGVGIGTDLLDKVFDPFYTTKKDGIGLGLAISRSIIAAHGGRLWATTRAESGSAFHLTLPAIPGEK
jgi:two-component system, LuxR family, sensor kinase FixL